MKEFLQSLLKEQEANGFPAVAGTDIKGRLPLRESLLNEVLRSALGGKKLPLNLQVNGLRIEPGNRIVLEGSATVLLRIPFSAAVRLEPTANIADGERIVAHLEGAAGLLSNFAGAVASKLPTGVTVTQQQVFVDVRALLTSRGQGSLAPLLRRIGFASERGALYIDFQIYVPQQRQG